MSGSEIDIGPEDPRRDDVRRIVAESGAYMQLLYPSESNHLVDVDALAAPEAVFLVARRDGEIVGTIASGPSRPVMSRSSACSCGSKHGEAE